MSMMGAIWLSVGLMVISVAAGLLIGRWFVVVVPLAALVGLHVALTREDWYERVPEVWQALAYAGLGVGVVGAVIGVIAAK
jgi:hypothetical protein